MNSQESHVFPISQDIITKEEFDVLQTELGDSNFLHLIENPTEMLNEDKPLWDANLQQYIPMIDGNSYTPQNVLQHNVLPQIQQIPTNKEYEGTLKFDIHISTPTSNNWNYSPIMKKCYLKINTTLPIDVTYESLPNTDLYLQAMPLYSLDEFSKDLVQRCVQHLDPNLADNLNVDPSILTHVLRCSNQGTMYLGNIKQNEHLCVLTPLAKPQTGVDSVRLNYKFMCKNSCPTGMNRRPIDLIFTLKDGFGNVYGRKKLGVRICSCPKRDKDKEEKEFRQKEGFNNENNQQNDQPPPNKKKKLMKKPTDNATDNAVITVPSFDLIGSDIVLDTLKFAQDRILAELHRGRFKNSSETHAKEIAKNLDTMMKNLKETISAENN